TALRVPPGPRILAKTPVQSMVTDLLMLKVALVLESNTSRQLMKPPPTLTASWAAWKLRQGNTRVQLLPSLPLPETKACRIAWAGEACRQTASTSPSVLGSAMVFMADLPFPAA